MLKSQAIQYALIGDWKNAITTNIQILEKDPNDLDTMNRLAFAYLSNTESDKAKELYEKVLTLDKQNPIAIRNLKRLNDPNSASKPQTITNSFIEEPGKTKVIDLLNIAEKNVISKLRSGEKLEITIKRSKLFILDTNGQFVGMLPDDICQRLIKFMEEGNEYEAHVRTVQSNKVSVLVRETKRAKKFKNQPSFVSTNENQKFTLVSSSRKR